MNINDLVSKIGGNDMVKGLADKAGLGAEQAQGLVTDLLAKAQETGGNLKDAAEEIAAKTGLPLDKVTGLAEGLGANLQEKAGELGDSATALVGNVLEKLNASPIGGLMKGFDKDGDGNPVNDITDAAKGVLGGLFGKKE